MRAGLPTFIGAVVVAGALGVLGFCLAGIHPEIERKADVPVAATAPTSAGTMRVMTVNVRIPDPDDGVNAWQNRREFLVKTLLKYGPDVIGCQEVTPAQGAYLIKELGNWYDHYPRAGVGKGDAETETSRDLTGSVNLVFASLNTLFFRADRFEIIDGEAGLAGAIQKDASENTFFTLAVLKEKQEAGSKKQEGCWIVVDTHLRHGEVFAQKCAATIREKIAAKVAKYPGAQVVVMGDMNHNADSKVYATLVGKNATDGAGVLTDSFDYSKRRPNESWGNWHAFKGISRMILPSDLIFTSSGLTSKQAELVRDKDAAGHYPSDHFFVMTEIQRK